MDNILFKEKEISRKKSYGQLRTEIYKRIRPISEHLAIYPPELSIDDIDLNKAIAFVPYCSKPLKNCPTIDKDTGRKNKKCREILHTCHIPCSINELVDVLETYWIKSNDSSERIFVIDNDSELFEWLKKKREEGYRFMFPGTACEFAINYALDKICEELGFQGLIIILGGEKCIDKKEYDKMESGDKRIQSHIPKDAITFIENYLRKEEKNV